MKMELSLMQTKNEVNHQFWPFGLKYRGNLHQLLNLNAVFQPTEFVVFNQM